MSFFKQFGQSMAKAAPGAMLGGIGSLFTIGAQKRAATTAFKRQKELFDYQNAYNTPAKQMERLKSAGLNPALMYGQGNTGNATGFAGVAKADVTGPDLAHSAAAGAQMSIVNSQRDLNNANAAYLAIKGANETGQLHVAQDLAKSSIEFNAQKIKESMVQTGNIQAQTDLAIQTINHQATTGMLKGDIMGNVAKMLDIDVSTKEGRSDAFKKVSMLIIGKKILDFAPQILSGIFGKLFRGGGTNQVIDGIRKGTISTKEQDNLIDALVKAMSK